MKSLKYLDDKIRKIGWWIVVRGMIVVVIYLIFTVLFKGFVVYKLRSEGIVTNISIGEYEPGRFHRTNCTYRYSVDAKSYSVWVDGCLPDNNIGFVAYLPLHPIMNCPIMAHPNSTGLGLYSGKQYNKKFGTLSMWSTRVPYNWPLLILGYD